MEIQSSKQSEPHLNHSAGDAAVCGGSARRSARLKLIANESSDGVRVKDKTECAKTRRMSNTNPSKTAEGGSEAIMEARSKKKLKNLKERKEVEAKVKRVTKENVSCIRVCDRTTENRNKRTFNKVNNGGELFNTQKVGMEATQQLGPRSLRKAKEQGQQGKYSLPRKGKLQNCKEIPRSRKLSDQPLCFNALDPSHTHVVKSALHLSTVPDNVLCREAEQIKVFGFCKEHILQQQAGSMYVCGCPGTGKSLIMEKVKFHSVKWAEEAGKVAPEVLTLNCTSLTNLWDIFRKVLLLLSPVQESKILRSSNLSILEEVKHLLCSNGKPGRGSFPKMLLLIVDELDYLITRDQSVLYELFCLPARPHSRCILIGISNAIDLTDRFLPKLQSLHCKPIVVTFSAYTKDQILTVLNQRLKELPFTVFHPAALELCARKVAAASGDMRKALHVCRGAFEILNMELDEEVETCGSQEHALDSTQLKIRQIGPNDNIKQEKHLVQVHHMAQALAKTFRSAMVEVVKSLPKHQQMILCSAVRLFRHGKKDANLGQLNTAYLEFCKSTEMHALSVIEFSSVCRVLADQGLLNLGSSQEDRLRRVTLQVDEEDIVFALQGVRFFRNNLL